MSSSVKISHFEESEQIVNLSNYDYSFVRTDKLEEYDLKAIYLMVESSYVGFLETILEKVFLN